MYFPYLGMDSLKVVFYCLNYLLKLGKKKKKYEVIPENSFRLKQCIERVAELGRQVREIEFGKEHKG